MNRLVSAALGTGLAAAIALTGQAGLVGQAGPAGSRAGGHDGGQRHRDDAVVRAFDATTRSTVWTRTVRIPLRFPTYHPQGFALVGDRVFMSAVEIIEAPVKYPVPVDGYDRTPGKGRGHVLVFDRQGNLQKDVVLGQGDTYHPGGIDFDGRSIWVPVAEYRPDSAAVVYKLDPDTFRVQEAFRVRDHVGGLVRDRVTGEVHGVSWGSRTLYTWTPNGRLLAKVANEDHMLDYQDCDYAGYRKQLCSGVTGLAGPNGTSYELGGIALRDLASGRILHEVPFPVFSAAGHSVNRNPVALEARDGTLRMLAAPDDGEEAAGTELLVFETPLPTP
jgi:uncharacterized protein DUF6454